MKNILILTLLGFRFPHFFDTIDHGINVEKLRQILAHAVRRLFNFDGYQEIANQV